MVTMASIRIHLFLRVHLLMCGLRLSQCAVKVDVAERFSRNLAFMSHKVSPRQLSMTPIPNLVGKLLQLQYREELEFVDAIPIGYDTTKTKLQEVFAGVPVSGHGVVVETQSGRYTGGITGSVVEGISQDISSVTPTISVQEALEIVRKLHMDDAEELTFHPDSDVHLEIHISDHTGFVVTPVLVYRLCYLVMTPYRQARPFTIINANTGRVIKTWEGLSTNKWTRALEMIAGDYRSGVISGPIAVRQQPNIVSALPDHVTSLPPTPAYSYTVPLPDTVYEYDGVGGNYVTGPHTYGDGYRVLLVRREGELCYFENDNVRVVDDDFQWWANDTFSFVCRQGADDAINGGYSPATDVFFYSNVGRAVFMEWAGVPPLTGLIEAHVHYGQSIENAYWTGRGVIFGDGKYRFHPFTSLDTIVHELAHGFTEQQSGLIYGGQSGAVNEAFSDIAGVAAEEYLNVTDWYQGAEIVKNNSSHLSRRFEKPSGDGRSIDHFSDYCPGMDVHYASGIINKAFFTLAHKPFWSVKKAFAVFALANRLYWTPQSTIAQAVCGVTMAAEDLNYNKTDVEEVFYEVGIQPCVEPVSSMQHATNMELADNSSLLFVYDVQGWVPTIKFEVLQGWFNRGNLRMSVRTPDGRHLSTTANTSQLLLQVHTHLRQGEYHLRLDAFTASSAVDMFAATLEDTLESGIRLDKDGEFNHHFQIPLHDYMAGNPVAIRVRSRFSFAPRMVLNFDEPVDLFHAKLKATSHFQKDNTDFLFSEVYLCNPGHHVYHYSLFGLANLTGISITYHVLLEPRLDITPP